MASTEATEHFVQQLAEHQNRLYGYVYSLLGDHSRAADVLQETNLVLWRKVDDFQPEKPFAPWAFAIARFQVLACLRDHKRDRLLLDAELAEQMSGVVAEQAQHLDEYRAPLQSCLESLTPTNRKLIEQRYFSGQSIANVADQIDRSVGAVKVALLRVRRQLLDCVQQKLAAER